MPGPALNLETIFAGALEHPAGAAREAWLRQACAGDNDLLREAGELLAAHDAAPSFLDSAPTASAPGQETIDENPPVLPGLRLERKLGRGGVGTVYLGVDEKLQRPVAVKVLNRAGGPGVRERLVREAQSAAALKDPGVVTIYSVLDEGPVPAIVMEVVDGFPLDRASAALSFEQKARVLREVARTLAAAHRRGLIHRDLKPGNILLTPELQPKILDFGLAVNAEEMASAVAGGWFEGTPRYASPEQAAGQPLTPATDLFSFGTVMFKVLTGRLPFERSNEADTLAAILDSAPPFLRDVAIGVPEALQAICLACLSAKPEDRPSAAEVELDLGRWLAGEPIRLRPALYGDILRKRIAEHGRQLAHWREQGMISADEQDRLSAVHRRILADEDHWIIDARKVSVAQTMLYTATWVVVLGAGLYTWVTRAAASDTMQVLAPLAAMIFLAGSGWASWRRNEPLASASFLAGAVLAAGPATLALLKHMQVLAEPPPNIRQFLEPGFTNQQLLLASLSALALSVFAWARLRMTGFAWTTSFLALASYMSLLLCANWLEKEPAVRALWTLPLVTLALPALHFEKLGRVRWAMPFYVIAGGALVAALDLIAYDATTLAWLGLGEHRHSYFTEERQQLLSLALNGMLFLGLMLLMERAKSLDLRRASRIMEPLGMLHLLGALYTNAQNQRQDSAVLADAILYIGAVVLILLLGAWRSSWRTLIGALAGLALGSHLLIDLKLVPESQFALGLAAAGIVGSAATFLYLLRAPRRKGTPRK